MTDSNQRMLVFVGSYAEPSGDGVYVYSFDENKGELQRLSAVSGLKNPTFLNIDQANRKCYAITETAEADGSKSSDAVVYSIDSTDGSLTEVSRARALNGPACHIQRRSDNRYLTLTSYHKGTVSLVELTDQNEIGAIRDIAQHEGHSVDPKNQDKPHPHFSFYSAEGRYLFVCDLGLDRIMAYQVNGEVGKLELLGETKLAPGAGPRHLTFHPNGQYAFVINELNSSVTAFAYDAAQGTLTEIQTLSTLPQNWTGENGCAEITISEDGRYLYGSNRGHDSIVVYAVDAETGRLSVVQHVSTEGGHPRHFSIVPGGQYVIAANRDANNLTVFGVDQQTGKLTYTGHSVELSKPVCVWAYRF